VFRGGAGLLGAGHVAPTCGAGRFWGYLPIVRGGVGAPMIRSRSAPLPSLASNSILFQPERPKFLIPVSKPERETPHFTSAQILVYSGQHQPECKFRPACKYAYFLFLFLNLEKAKAVKQMVVLIVYVSIKFSSFM
jgi:hypothetical protein